MYICTEKSLNHTISAPNCLLSALNRPPAFFELPACLPDFEIYDMTKLLFFDRIIQNCEGSNINMAKITYNRGTINSDLF